MTRCASLAVLCLFTHLLAPASGQEQVQPPTVAPIPPPPAVYLLSLERGRLQIAFSPDRKRAKVRGTVNGRSFIGRLKLKDARTDAEGYLTTIYAGLATERRPSGGMMRRLPFSGDTPAKPQPRKRVRLAIELRRGEISGILGRDRFGGELLRLKRPATQSKRQRVSEGNSAHARPAPRQPAPGHRQPAWVRPSRGLSGALGESLTDDADADGRVDRRPRTPLKRSELPR